MEKKSILFLPGYFKAQLKSFRFCSVGAGCGLNHGALGVGGARAVSRLFSLSERC